MATNPESGLEFGFLDPTQISFAWVRQSAICVTLHTINGRLCVCYLQPEIENAWRITQWHTATEDEIAQITSSGIFAI